MNFLMLLLMLLGKAVNIEDDFNGRSGFRMDGFPETLGGCSCVNRKNEGILDVFLLNDAFFKLF